MKKSNKIKYTDIKKTLNESLFNPNTPGPLSIILEQNDPSFYETRAIELIREAQLFLLEIFSEKEKENYRDKITKAISLLALAKTIRLKGL